MRPFLLPIMLVLLCGTGAGYMWQISARLTVLEGKVERQTAFREPALPTDTGRAASGGIILGNRDAPVTLVQFTDYECPFCRRFAQDVLPLLLEKYVSTGTVRIVIRDLPLPNHQHARTYAAAARCAASLGADNLAFQLALYEGASMGPHAAIPLAAVEGQVDVDAVSDCVSTGTHAGAIDSDIAEAQRLRIRGTPSFLIGRSANEVVGRLLHGVHDVNRYSAVIDSVLGGLIGGQQ